MSNVFDKISKVANVAKNSTNNFVKASANNIEKVRYNKDISDKLKKPLKAIKTERQFLLANFEFLINGNQLDWKSFAKESEEFQKNIIREGDKALELLPTHLNIDEIIVEKLEIPGHLVIEFVDVITANKPSKSKALAKQVVANTVVSKTGDIINKVVKTTRKQWNPVAKVGSVVLEATAGEAVDQLTVKLDNQLAAKRLFIESGLAEVYDEVLEQVKKELKKFEVRISEQNEDLEIENIENLIDEIEQEEGLAKEATKEN
ncbi:MAG: hypothetical protein LBN08_01080 [Lactobacillales bacterium]|jgi:hypothetical protein|nr:hypothetical protein [Lactobacillales bacterium]